MALNFNTYIKRFSGKWYGYGNASHAIYDVLNWLQKNRPREKPNIVMPVYIPAKLYRYVIAAGYQPVFYDVDPDLGFDPKQVARLIDDQTQAVMAIHYFGIPAPVKELKPLTEKANVFLIEDCAHTLNSRFEGIELGATGDGAIFSVRKLMQLAAGGILILNSPEFCKRAFRPTFQKKVRNIFIAWHLIISRMKYFYYNLTKGFDPLNLTWIPRTGYIDFSEEQRVTTRKIARLSSWYMQSVDLDKISERRRINYNFLLNATAGFTTLKPAFPDALHENTTNGSGNQRQLIQGITPFCFPVMLADAEKRSELRRLLRDNGTGCGAGWPEAPFHHTEYARTRIFSEQLLELPVHQGITFHQLRRMADTLRAFEFKVPDETGNDAIETLEKALENIKRSVNNGREITRSGLSEKNGMAKHMVTEVGGPLVKTDKSNTLIT